MQVTQYKLAGLNLWFLGLSGPNKQINKNIFLHSLLLGFLPNTFSSSLGKLSKRITNIPTLIFPPCSLKKKKIKKNFFFRGQPIFHDEAESCRKKVGKGGQILEDIINKT